MAGRLDLAAILEMDRAVAALKSKVKTAVPAERGFRATAAQYVEDLSKATKMFNAETIGFAREMVSDTQRHDAHTVGELLAFMRKYRLLFASAETSPGGGEMYGRLYGLLQEQKEALGLRTIAEPVARVNSKGGWVSLFNGNDLDGWEAYDLTGKTDVSKNWKVENGVIHGSGPLSHLFSPHGGYRNFCYRAEVKVGDRANSGMYFRTVKGAGYPKGYEAQLNSNHRDPVRTGSLYNFVPIREMLVPPDTWFTQEVDAVDDHIVIKVNGQTVVDYFDLKNSFTEGYFAFQQHDPGGDVWIRKIEIKELP